MTVNEHAPSWVIRGMLGLLICGVMAKSALPTRVTIQNVLPTPISVSIDAAPAVILASGASLTLWQYLPPAVTWQALSPSSATLDPRVRPQGEIPPLTMPIAVYRLTVSRYRIPIHYRSAAFPLYAPLVTNLGVTPVRIELRSGGSSWIDCSCEIKPGSQRAFVGYFAFDSHSALRARTAQGPLLTIDPVEPEISRQNGVLEVVVH